MKSIALSIDEAGLEALDRMARAAARGRPGNARGRRSELVRRAVREFVQREERREREERERRVIQAHREKLARQAAALIAGQAEP